MKKVLLISYNALMSSSPNGRTMQSLLQGIPKNNISLFTCYGMPDEASCASAFKVSNRDALRSLIFSSKSGREIDMENVSVKQSASVESDARKGAKKAWKYLAKELVWLLGRWKNRRLKTWLKEQNPDVILYMYGDSPAMQRFAVYVSRMLSKPLVVYSCEDYCFKDYNYIDDKKCSISFKIYQRWYKKTTKKLFANANALITNSDQLGKDYQEKYGIKNVSTVMMASNMSHVENSAVRPENETSVSYLGALGNYRVKALIEIGKSLQKINSCLKLDVYGRADEQVRLKLESCEGIRYHGFVSYEKVQEVMRNSSLLIEAINNDPYVCKDKKYGLSTKYADSFACGTPFLVYAPDAIIETRFAKEHKCAFVATEVAELEDVLKTALFDLDARKEQLSLAKKVTENYFDNAKNINTVNDVFNSVTR